LVYFDPGRLDAISRRGVEGAPTLAIEILSPSTAVVDRTRQRALYARYAVPWLWLVDPDGQSIDTYGLRDDEYVPAARAAGRRPVDVPPFAGLGLVPSSLWP